MEQCFVSEGEDSLPHQERSHTMRAHTGAATPTCTHSGTLIHPKLEAISPTKADQTLFAGYQSVSAGFNSP